MTKATATADATAQDVLNAIGEGVNEMTAEAPAKKTTRKKAASKSKAKAAPEAAEPKPEPKTFHGFEVKEGVDLKALEKDAEDLAGAVESIRNKDADLLASYLMVGKGASQIAPMFKSKKLYGQFLAQVIPASQSLDPALRSNCKWLYEALNFADADGADLLKVLGVNRLEDFKSQNPTVIKREYKAAKKKAEALEKAKAAGIEAEDEEAAIAEMKEKEAKKEAANKKRQITQAIKRFRTLLEQHGDKADAVAEAEDIMREVLTRKNGEQVEYLLSL